MQRYSKAWAGGLAAALVSIIAAFVDLEPDLSGALITVIGSVIFTMAAVYAAPKNKP